VSRVDFPGQSMLPTVAIQSPRNSRGTGGGWRAEAVYVVASLDAIDATNSPERNRVFVIAISNNCRTQSGRYEFALGASKDFFRDTQLGRVSIASPSALERRPGKRGDRLQSVFEFVLKKVLRGFKIGVKPTEKTGFLGKDW
jgi:hypothetical protein